MRNPFLKVLLLFLSVLFLFLSVLTQSCDMSQDLNHMNDEIKINHSSITIEQATLQYCSSHISVQGVEGVEGDTLYIKLYKKVKPVSYCLPALMVLNVKME